MEDEELESFLMRRFPGRETLIKRCVEKLADEGFSSLADLKVVSFEDARQLGVPFAFAARLGDEGYFKPASPAPRRRSLRPRSFYSGDAINVERHYYCRWPDFDALVNDVEGGQWLLLTGPWQSGKTSLLTALGGELERRGYLVLFTPLDRSMLELGNNLRKAEVEAAGDFYSRLIDKLCHAAGGNELHKPAGEVVSVTEVFRIPAGEKKFKNVIWLIDEAQILNHIHHQSSYAVRSLLSSLREAKRESVSRNKHGTSRLHNFCLCGLPQLAALIGDVREPRIVPSSPYDPLRPWFSSPLSKQVHRDVWKVDEQQVAGMIHEYAQDRGMLFKLTLDGERGEEEHSKAVLEIARDIVERTSGHTGLVGSCCSFLQKIGTEIWSLDHWLRLAGRGELRRFVFDGKAFGRSLYKVADFPPRVKSVILDCVHSPDGCSDVGDIDEVLEAIADGVLERRGACRVGFTSPLLLASILESCKFARMELPVPRSIDSMVEVYEVAISLMNPEVFLRPKVLNATSGQPFEYIIQSQLFRAIMFVMEQGWYTPHKYHVFVEVKERDEEGVRRRSMDVYMESAWAPKQGVEIEVGSNDSGSSVKNRLERCAYYKKLQGCEMKYMYFWVGDVDDPTGAKAVMERLSKRFLGVQCWYVRFRPGTWDWIIERLKDDGKWVTVSKVVSPEFPRFLLS